MEKIKNPADYLNETVAETLSSFDLIKLLIEEEHNMGYDTIEVGDEEKIMYNEVLLPKSQVMSYNLYKLSDMRVLTALKYPNEPKNVEEREADADSIDKFMERISLHIHYLLKDNPVDMIAYPKSSSDFIRDMVDCLMERYKESPNIQLVPDLLTKSIRRAYVNTNVAKELGLPDFEIYRLLKDVEQWQADAEVYELQVEINELKDSIAYATGKRGRPTREVSDKKELVKNLEKQLTLLREIRKGENKAKDKKARAKNIEIESFEEKRRRSIEGLFEINPELRGIQQDLRGKHLVVFDDCISSGATMDDICLELQRCGVASILPITLAVVPNV